MKRLLKRIYHKLFHCPTFWKLKPTFYCPICGKGYRCYWDGNDSPGNTKLKDVCDKCATRIELTGTSKTVRRIKS